MLLTPESIAFHTLEDELLNQMASTRGKLDLSAADRRSSLMTRPGIIHEDVVSIVYRSGNDKPSIRESNYTSFLMLRETGHQGLEWPDNEKLF